MPQKKKFFKGIYLRGRGVSDPEILSGATTSVGAESKDRVTRDPSTRLPGSLRVSPPRKTPRGLIYFYLLILSGCTTASPFVRQMVDLHSIHEGMSLKEVKDILGDQVVTGYDLTHQKKDLATPIILKNPYREEVLKIGERTYEIAYYFTSIKKQDGVITNDELTPLVFENNRLIGWGWSFLNKLKKSP